MGVAISRRLPPTTRLLPLDDHYGSSLNNGHHLRAAVVVTRELAHGFDACRTSVSRSRHPRISADAHRTIRARRTNEEEKEGVGGVGEEKRKNTSKRPPVHGALYQIDNIYARVC